MLQSLRPLLTKILNPLARNLNINPNIITVISPFVALIAAYGFANHMLILGTLAILFSVPASSSCNCIKLVLAFKSG